MYCQLKFTVNIKYIANSELHDALWQSAPLRGLLAISKMNRN